MQEDATKGDATDDKNFTELTASLAKVFAEVEGITKGATNPAFRSKYADLSSVLEVLRPVMAKHSLFVVQNPTLEIQELGPDAEGSTKTYRYMLCLTTVIFHANGAQMAFPTFRIPVTKEDAPGVGSATTYARRYVLLSIFCLSTEDDDGNAASGREVAGGKEIQARVVRR